MQHHNSSSGFIHLSVIIAGLVLAITTVAGGLVVSELNRSQDNRSQAVFSCAVLNQASCQSTPGLIF